MGKSITNTNLLTNLGLLNQNNPNNHSSPIRKNNTLLDRPEVVVPVNIYIKKYLFGILLNKMYGFRKSNR